MFATCVYFGINLYLGILVLETKHSQGQISFTNVLEHNVF